MPETKIAKKRGGYRTVKQLRAISILAENPGKPVAQAMIEAGYSPNTANSPAELTQSQTFKDWNERLGFILSDELLAKKLREGLEATKIHSSHTEPDQEVPDHANRHKYLETSLKLRGKLADPVVNMQVIVPVQIIAKNAADSPQSEGN